MTADEIAYELCKEIAHMQVTIDRLEQVTNIVECDYLVELVNRKDELVIKLNELL